MDCVLSHHTSWLTCGVAKFNFILAQKLSVPMYGLFDPAARAHRRPLLSVKISELGPEDLPRFSELVADLPGRGGYDVFFHDFGGSEIERRLLMGAGNVYCGNTELFERCGALRADVMDLWCPGTLLGIERGDPVELSVFSFGMAHKVRVELYRRLRDLLERTGRPYRLFLSTALHDNTTFDRAVNEVLAQLGDVFAGSMTFMGFLSDPVIKEQLARTTFFAAFFEKGVRANNTSVHAAMQSGAVVLTNLDRHSPAWLVHGQNVLNVQQLRDLPLDPDVLSELGSNARRSAELFGWDALLTRLTTSRPMSVPSASDLRPSGDTVRVPGRVG